MAYIDTDIIVHIYQTVQDNLIGHQSKYTDEEYPGTNKMIEGWKWDKRTWAPLGEFKAVEFAPSIWDPVVSGIDEDSYQSGYGDNKDLLLIDINEVIAEDSNIWAPRLQHGYFYSYDKEWYLYSDSHITEYFTISGVESDNQVLTLSGIYKPTIPIQVRSYEFNRTLAQHSVYRDFRRKIEFSDSPEGPEFTVNTSTNPAKITLDRIYDEAVGSEITLSVSGTADPSDIYGLDIVGLSDGSDGQEFSLKYSPVYTDSIAQVWAWVDANYPMGYTIIDPLDVFTTGEREVKLDTDRGTLTFGTVGSGIVPPGGHQIGAYYTIGTQVVYEPENSIDSILAYSTAANINPVAAATDRGFVQVGTESIDPASIVLSSDLTFSIDAYIISLGNNVGEMIAEVKGINGDILEGQEVTFEIIDPHVGSFGTA